jgi:hypothetical protein
MDNILVTLVVIAGCGAVTLVVVIVSAAIAAKLLGKVTADDELTAEIIYRVMHTKDGIEP